jgi:hypothetical protein
VAGESRVLMKKSKYFLLFLILAAHLLLLINLKFTAWPEMLAWPYLITKGWLPYVNIAIAHTPLMLADLSIFYKIFGVGISQLKAFTWLLILTSDVVVFVIVKKLWNLKTAFYALISFAVWGLFYDGNGLWFDLYVSVLGLCCFYFARRREWIWLGIFWAAAFMSKQTAFWLLAPILYEMWGRRQKVRKNIVRFAEGALPMIIAFLIVMWAFGVLPGFWNWAIKFGIFILPRASGQVQLPNLRTLALAGFPFLVFVPLLIKTGKKNLNLLIWAVAGGLGAYPRFELFHFQPAVPYLAIASGVFFAGFFTKRIWKNTPIKVVSYAYIIVSFLMFGGFFMRDFREVTRFYDQEVTDVVTFVSYNTSRGDRIFVLNWWDNIYALTDTIPSVNPWVPQLSWYMEIPGIQDKMVKSLATNPPKLIIFNPYSTLGLSAYIPQKIYNYVTENYTLSQRVDNLEVLIPKQ